MITNTSPIGRDSMRSRDKMLKYHAEIERMVYAAEIECHKDRNGELCDNRCPFEASNGIHCNLKFFRTTIGNPVIQHDLQENL